MKDTQRHQGMRNLLVNELKTRGIKDSAVLEAINQVPRHFFISSAFEMEAYKDMAFPIASGQTISRPSTVAFQTELLQVKRGQKVLEIGTGSGYQSAVLLHLGVKLYTIERQQELFKKTKIFFAKMGYFPIKMVFGDGYKGLPNDAPFDRIIVTAGAPETPKALLDQLAIGGRLVIPVGENTQRMMLFQKKSEDEFHCEEFGDFAFVPMLERVQVR